MVEFLTYYCMISEKFVVPYTRNTTDNVAAIEMTPELIFG